MLSPSSNPLLNDFEAEKHQFLLEKGNLVKKPPAVSWSDENCWKSLGYEAHINRLHCTCGRVTHILTGIYHAEVTPSGKKRSLALSPKAQWPLDQKYPVVENWIDVPHCAHCITSKGFSRG